ncbi:MAG: extracellular solute-binding protein, partial [Chloroflexales bacterium]|nr:extracellular solute-binding protein [Chloroflexales bacterium]
MRYIRFLFVIFLLLGSFSGCMPFVSPSAPSAPPLPTATMSATVITFAAPAAHRHRYEAAILAFNTQQTHTRVQFVAFDTTSDITQTASAADTAVVAVRDATAISNGALADLRPLMEADPTFDRSDFYAPALHAASTQTGVYLLPHIVTPALLFYNKNLWEQRQAPPPSPDWSWNDVLHAAAQLSQPSSETPIYGIWDDQSGFELWLSLLATQHAPSIAQPIEPIQLDTPALVAALDNIAASIKAGVVYISPDSQQQSSSAALTDLIRAQQLGIWPGRTGLPTSANATLPFAVGAAVAPPTIGGGVSLHTSYSMSSGAQHPQAAWDWLSFLSQQNL